MELYQEILAKVLQSQTVQVQFPTLSVDVKQIVEMECYRALSEIKEIIEDDCISDTVCFLRIKQIVCMF